MSIDQATRRLGRDDDGQLVSAEEFAEADFDEPWKYERAEGRLIVAFPDSEAHVNTANPILAALFFHWGANRDLVQKIVPNAWLKIGGSIDRISDIGVYLVGEDLGQIPARIPELVFEVVSPSAEDKRRDYVEKRVEYHDAGVREYVIVDRFARVVTVLEHEADGYRERTLRPGEAYRTPLLPGLAIDLATIF